MLRSGSWLSWIACGLIVFAGIPAQAQQSAAPSVPTNEASSAPPMEPDASRAPSVTTQSSSRMPTLTDAATAAAQSLVTRGAADRAAVILACHDTHDVDYLLWVGAAGMIATGLALTVWSFTTPPMQRTPVQYFAQGIGPGLVLGGIGFPFPRGIVKDQDPLTRVCERIEHPRHGEVDLIDVDVAATLMRDLGPAASPIMVGLLTLATVVTTAGVITAFTLEATNPGRFRELVQLAGGVYAGVVTSWFLIPANPERRAAARFQRNYYRARTQSTASIFPTNGGLGVGLVGTF